MAKLSNADKRIRLLVQKYRSEFKRPENTNFYSDNDYKEAEKKFVKFCLTCNTKSDTNRVFAVN
jgi:hypothetical protein